MHDQNRAVGIKRSGADHGVPTVAAELLVIVVLVDNGKITPLKHTLGVQPIPLNAVRVEKARDVERKLFARDHASDDALGF